MVLTIHLQWLYFFFPLLFMSLFPFALVACLTTIFFFWLGSSEWHVWWEVTWRHFSWMNWPSISHYKCLCEQFSPWKHLMGHLKARKAVWQSWEGRSPARCQLSESASLLDWGDDGWLIPLSSVFYPLG